MTNLNNHQEKVAGYLERFRDNGVLNHINGEACHAVSGEVFKNLSPVDGSLICRVAKSASADVDKAVAVAKSSFPEWRDMDGSQRKKILHAIADGIVARAEEIALCECWDTGQAFRFMSKAALRGAENFRFFADRAPGARDGQSLPSSTLMNITTINAPPKTTPVDAKHPFINNPHPFLRFRLH